MRQPRGTPTEEKLRYVDTIVDLLELNDLQHTLIGRPGAGLSVEQRKRHTIGVELVAKPSILIFLDEPTSGLDGQAAYNTVRFLRKLAEAGQAILVTIHQPSAQLFAQFDKLLLLAAGSKTVYFGDIGQNANTVKEYFGTTARLARLKPILLNILLMLCRQARVLTGPGSGWSPRNMRNCPTNWTAWLLMLEVDLLLQTMIHTNSPLRSGRKPSS